MKIIKKTGQLKSIISLLLFISILFISVFAINESLNQTNSSLQDGVLNVTPDLNITSDVNISINVSVDINQTEDNLSNKSVINETASNQTINISSTEEIEDLIKRNKKKLNKKTEDYLATTFEKKEEKDYIVKFKNSINNEVLTDVKLKDVYERFNTAKIESNFEDVSIILDNPEIEYLELDQNTELLSDNIPYNIDKTKAPLVWNLTKGNGVKIAVLDTGISPHSDLSIADGTSVISDNFNDNNGHGTAVAGVISALLNDEGLVGVSPELSLYAIKIMENSQGQLSDAIEGLEWAIDNNMEIITMSFGMESYSQIFKDILEEAYNGSILLVAAAGNNNGNILYPAAYDTVIAVGAVNENNERASFSSYGLELELVADGVDVNSTSLDNGYDIRSGTSMAAPHVAGVAALIKAYNNSLSNTQIRAKLQNDALDLGEEGKDGYYGYGLVQVNIESYNYTLQNESYFYEIFNITNFGTENQDYLFWINGTGTVDDVTFSEGYYLVNITIEDIVRSYVYNVSENGTIFILTNAVYLWDNYSNELSSTSDGFTWVNGKLQVRTTIDEGMSNVDAECYDTNGVPSNYELCFFKTTQIKNDCDDSKGQIDCVGFTDCRVETPGIWHNLSTSSIDKKTLKGYCYLNDPDCNDPLNPKVIDTPDTYNIINKKRYYCGNATLVVFQGYSGGWEQYSTQQCSGPGICDPTRVYDEFTTPDPDMLNYNAVCVNPCSGIIEVNVLDSDGKPLNGSHVYLDGVYRNTTNDQGQKTLGGTSCNVYHNVSIYCADNQTRLCETKQVDVPLDGSTPALIFDCNLCNNKANLKISLGDVDVDSDENIIVNVHTENINAPSGVNVTVMGQSKITGLIERQNSALTPAISSSTRNVSVVINLNLADIDYIHVYVDPEGEVAEPKDDNYVLRPFVKDKIKAYLDINTGNSKVDEAIREYLKIFVHPQPSPGGVSIIAIGKKTNYTKEGTGHNSFLLEQFNRGLRNNQIIYNGKSLGILPYIGLISSFHYQDVDFIFAYGKDIEGDIAIVKKLISHSDIFFSASLKGDTNNWYDVSQEANVIDMYDTMGIGVFDLLHNNETEQYFNQVSGFKGERFKEIVEDVLNDNNYEISIKTVKTTNDNTTLRLKNVNSDFSTNFQDAVVNNSKPVVLSRGIHSNLLTWEDFGRELAFDKNNARDTWLIEMVGGPTIDEDCLPSGKYNCPNYTFSDLKTYYWPALITGVQSYSRQKTLDYVGFSLGCSAALESLELYGSTGKANAGYVFDSVTGNYLSADLSSNPIDTFVAVACPGNFTKLSLYMYYANKTEKEHNLIQSFKNKGNLHPKQKDIIKEIIISSLDLHPIDEWLIAQIVSLFASDNKMAIEIYQSFIDWMNTAGLPEIGKNVSLTNFMIIQGKFIKGNERDIETDKIVSTLDQRQICQNIQSNNKYYVSFENKDHGSLSTDSNVKKVVKDFLADGDIDITQNLIYNKDCSIIG